MNERQVYNPSHGEVGGYPSAYQKERLRTVIKIDCNKKMASFLILLVGFVIYWKDRLMVVRLHNIYACIKH